ncbi:MAG: hypothetical protein ACTSSE_05390 [Candidatus Thorarchaeota archaeon]
MGDLEEVISRKYLLIDTWDVRHQHFLITGFSILMFVIYWVFMWLLCSLTPSITTSLLLLGSQIGLGLPATRAFYDFGVTTRGMLKFYDAGILGNDFETVELKINTGDISLLFERLDFQIRKYDSGAIDDLNDLAWFTIVVWAVISSAGILTVIAGIPICSFGAIVLVITCFISYTNGYRTVRGVSFEEDLSHLEYYVDRCVKAVDKAMPKENGTVVLQVTKHGKRTVLIDIIVEFCLPQETVIEYHLGLSSHKPERFIIVAPSESLETAYSKFKNFSVVKDSTWYLEQVTTQSGRIIRIVNNESILCVCDRSTFVVNPETVEKNTQATNKILSDIASIIKTSLDTN